jgi:hypothetical protein
MEDKYRALIFSAVRGDGTACQSCGSNNKVPTSENDGIDTCARVYAQGYAGCPIVERTVVDVYNFKPPAITAPHVGMVDPLADVPLNNLFFVGVEGSGALRLIKNPAILSRVDAVNLAAWLLILADHHRHLDSFGKLIDRIMESDGVDG